MSVKLSLVPMPLTTEELGQIIPPELRSLEDHQKDLPRIARDPRLTELIRESVQRIPSSHLFYHRDARDMGVLDDSSVHLVLTSPPYWTLKRYREIEGQLGHLVDYEAFLSELKNVWEHVYRVLVPGGRLICVVGDVCLSRRKNGGRHRVVPLHASIQEQCRGIGLDNLAPIIWNKIANASYESENGTGGFLGKPYEPNAVIKNDIEYLLMERKPGGYRKPSVQARILSVISSQDYGAWFRQIWTDVPGASTRDHPAPFPLALADRLVRMFSFVGDTVLDPFTGTGTTSVAAARSGRNSVGFEIDEHYLTGAESRMRELAGDLFSETTVTVKR